jgi:hypothetical protein
MGTSIANRKRHMAALGEERERLWERTELLVDQTDSPEPMSREPVDR